MEKTWNRTKQNNVEDWLRTQHSPTGVTGQRTIRLHRGNVMKPHQSSSLHRAADFAVLIFILSIALHESECWNHSGNATENCFQLSIVSRITDIGTYSTE